MIMFGGAASDEQAWLDTLARERRMIQRHGSVEGALLWAQERSRVLDVLRRRVRKVVRRRELGACWEWLGARKAPEPGRKEGGPALSYGRIWYAGRTEQTHRVALALRGDREPRELGLVSHRCDNPLCVNPLHLEESTPGANLEEAYRRGRR